MVDWLVVGFESDIKNHYSTVVTTNGNQSWTGWVIVNTHNTRLGGKAVLGPGGVFNCETTNQTSGLSQKIVATVGNSEKIFVPGVPGHGCDVLATRLLCCEAPKR